MKKLKFRNALVSVSDKTGLAEFIKPLADQGMRVLSTGGSAQYLREAGVKVVDVSEQTGFPEVMDGRVKTLHPNIHMALLAREGNAEDSGLLKQYGVEPIDLVVVNLYPFEAALAKSKSENEQIEYIDIGGPSLLRAAAKNFQRITLVCDPSDYKELAGAAEVDLAWRKRLAAKVFSHCSSYDAMIAGFLGDTFGGPQWSIGGQFVQSLRYGENPHQAAAWYRLRGEANGLHSARILQGKELSYNNLLDLDAAVSAVRDFNEPACVAVKHNNPCGVAQSSTAKLAVELALKADPVSVFGGIVAINRPVDAPMAEILGQVFLECVVAPEVSTEARAVFSAKKNLRVLEWSELTTLGKAPRARTVDGGFVVQSADSRDDWQGDWDIIGDQPTDQVRQDLLFAWRVCARLKSNAIAIAAHGRTLGLGMGQVNRVDAVAQSIDRWRHFHPTEKSAVLASDAFFPFADSIERIAQAGIRWVIQPGGSVRDDEVKAKARELGVNMVLTGRRHFSH